MKVTKYIHSCLVVKEENQTILIDPGIYSIEEKALTINTLDNLDYLLITHEHQDHMYIPFIKELVAKFPKVKIISNKSVVKIFENEGITSTNNSDNFINIESIPHENVFGITPPENVLFRINNLLTHPGDSFQFSNTIKILALPVQAPWGSLTEAVELAEKIKPEIILPIHDWHWNESARNSFYLRLKDYFKNIGIKFIPLQSGQEYLL